MSMFESEWLSTECRDGSVEQVRTGPIGHQGRPFGPASNAKSLEQLSTESVGLAALTPTCISPNRDTQPSIFRIWNIVMPFPFLKALLNDCGCSAAAAAAVAALLL